MTMALFLLFLFLKQFYILPSGSVGTADLCLLLCFVLLLGRQCRKTAARGEDLPFCLFLCCVAAINGCYALWEESADFLRNSLFWMYNGMAIWCFFKLGEQKEFERWTGAVLKINILVQTGIWLSGRGRQFYEPWGGVRYMGTFNDPNQLAFFMFSMVLLLYLCGGNKRDRSRVFFYIPAIAVVAASKSTGISLGMLIFIAGAGVQKAVQGCGRRKNPALLAWAFGCGAAGLILLAAFSAFPENDFFLQEEPFTVFGRVQEKLWKARQGGLTGILADRVLDKIVLYPQYLLCGAGEGGFDRFSLAAHVNEIHSSLLSIWFCYGVFPTAMLLLWLKRQLGCLEGWMWPAVLALLAESFFLVNYRQPLFWMVLIYGRMKGRAPSAVRTSWSA